MSHKMDRNAINVYFMRLLAVVLSLMPISIYAHKTYEFADTWNDANKGGFADPAPIITPSNDEESDFFFEYAYVPARKGMKPLFCLRKGESAKAVKCFYVDEKDSRGEVVVEAVIPR